MDRIYNPEQVDDDRQFTEGDFAQDVPATPLAAIWLNDVQEEVCAVIERNGFTLDPSRQDQLYEVIRHLVRNANATSIDSLPVTMGNAAEGYLLKVTGAAGSEQIVAVPANLVATASQVARRYFDSATEVIVGTTYHLGTATVPNGTSTTLSNATTTANSENLVVEFASGATADGFTLESGLWPLCMWQRASSAGVELRLKLFVLDELSGQRLQVGTTLLYLLENTVDEFRTFDIRTTAPVAIAPGQRLVFSLYAFSTQDGQSITVSFHGADRQSYVELPVAAFHNAQSGLQGGSTSERYHLTAAQAALVAGLESDPPLATGCVVEVFPASGTWTKPQGAKFVHCLVIAAGGGAGSGRRGAPSTDRCGGMGGQGGGVAEDIYPGDMLPDSIAISVGLGGVGGAAATTDDTDGAAGASGGNSLFGTYADDWMLIASGGRGGVGGATSPDDLAVPSSLFGSRAPQPVGPTSVGAGKSPLHSSLIASKSAYEELLWLANRPRSGLGGHGINAANVLGTGGSAPLAPPHYYGTLIPGNGTKADSYSGTGFYGGMGMPGSSQLGADAIGGGDGTPYGGGGGGGGASENGYPSGAGGDGHDGVVVVTTYF